MDGTTLWFAAFALYAFDAVRPLSRPAVFLRLQIDGASAELVEPSFRIAGRGIRVPNLLRPDIMAFALQADPTFCAMNATGKLSDADCAAIATMTALFRPVALASMASGIIILGLVPVMAMRFALTWAILTGLLACYVVILFGWISLRKCGLPHTRSDHELRKELLYSLLCPPNAINMARRIGDRQTLPYDAEATLRTFAPGEIEKYLQYFQSDQGDRP